MSHPSLTHCALTILCMTASLLSGFQSANAAEDPDAKMVATWKASVLKLENITKHTDGEDLGWMGSPYLRGMVKMAEARGDRECLDLFCKAFEHLMSITSEDIDQLYGWPTVKGSYGKAGKRCIIMDDALLCEPVGIFCRVVNADPALKKDYGERAVKYLAFVEEKIFPKWQDSWLDLKDKALSVAWDGRNYKRSDVLIPEPAGVYRFVTPGKKPGMSLPLNQFWHVAKCYLALYDATKKDFYLDKITKMARTGKYVYMEKTGDRVRPWCYWRPVYDGDFKSENEGVHWIGPHPDRTSYASVEVMMMTEFHKRKIVFTDEDIQRVVKLHLEFQWNKDLDNPKFDYPYDRRPGYTKPYPVVLWTSLAYADPTIAKLSAAKRSTPEQAHSEMEALASKWGGIESVPDYLLKQKAAAK